MQPEQLSTSLTVRDDLGKLMGEIKLSAPDWNTDRHHLVWCCRKPNYACPRCSAILSIWSLNLLNQSRLNSTTFCCIELCFLMRTVSCNPVVCITLRKCHYVMWWFKTIWCVFLYYLGQALICVLFLQVLNYSFRYGGSTAVVQRSWVAGNDYTWRRDLHLMCPAPLPQKQSTKTSVVTHLQAENRLLAVACLKPWKPNT